MAHDRSVAGIRCSDVLEELSDYVDGQLPRDRAERIEAHLRGCDWCERFGGDFADAIAALRRALSRAPAANPAVHDRLMARLGRETRRG